uniref:Uncharacterized protein n=1 Tax=Rangifer tarandus platyrhynchus TaxID=3082113 RepID=A0ACB0F4S1_RANTA|nr:unnamed protein product [Rangifer tarandus platyrhynchus]
MKRALRAWPTLPRAPPFTELAWPRTGLPTRAESRLSRSLRRSLTPTDKMQVEQKFLSHCSEPPGALLKCSVCLGRAGVRDSAFVLVKNFLIMESSTGFGAKDAKLRVTRSLATSRGLGSEGHGRPSRPAPPLPTPRLPEGARGVGHLLPAAGTRRLTPHPRPPARSASPLAPRGVPATPPPALRTAGTVAPAPPASAPSSRRITGALEPAGWGAPARGGSLRALPEPGAGGPLPRRTRLIHAKLIPAASRPPARGRAPALAEPRSLHPPPPPPPGGGVPGAPGDLVSPPARPGAPTRAAAARSRPARLLPGRREEMASRPRAPGARRPPTPPPSTRPPRPPAPCARPAPSGSPPPHLPPQVRAPPGPVRAVPSTPESSPGGDVAAVLVAARPPTRLRAQGGSGLGVIPLVGREEGTGDEDTGPGGVTLRSPGSAGPRPPRSSLLLQTTCGACRGRRGALAPPGASLPPGVWRSPPIANPGAGSFGKYLACACGRHPLRTTSHILGASHGVETPHGFQKDRLAVLSLPGTRPNKTRKTKIIYTLKSPARVRYALLKSTPHPSPEGRGSRLGEEEAGFCGSGLEACFAGAWSLGVGAGSGRVGLSAPGALATPSGRRSGRPKRAGTGTLSLQGPQGERGAPGASGRACPGCAPYGAARFSASSLGPAPGVPGATCPALPSRVGAPGSALPTAGGRRRGRLAFGLDRARPREGWAAPVPV